MFYSPKAADRVILRASLLSSIIMELFGFLWQIFAFIIMIIFEKLANVADEIMFTLEDYEVYDNIFRVRSFKQDPD